MATSSILGGERAPMQPGGADVESLGPSDTSDSGSDARGALGVDELESDSDAAGTGERASLESVGRVSGDILPDHVERAPSGEGVEPMPDDAMTDSEADLQDLAADDDAANEGVDDLDDEIAG
jgi:hypothetical protein